MIRFAWLQTRSQTLIGSALLAAVAVAALLTGIQLAHVYQATVVHCRSGCDLAVQQYLSHDAFMDQTLDILARAVPALLGVFWGAPLLAREYESGTVRLAWTQSVSKRRWLLTRVGLGAVSTAILAGLSTLTVTWWYRDRIRVAFGAHGTFDPYTVFDRRDLVPVAYALFAFAIGVMFGAVLRRTLPAMAATLGLFALTRIAVSLWVRPHLFAARHAVVSLARQGPASLGIELSGGGVPHVIAQGGGPVGSWVQSSHFLDASGQPASAAQLTAFLHQHCTDLLNAPASGSGQVPTDSAGASCLAAVSRSYRLSVAYQPPSRYWLFQWTEAGIFIALALIAAAATYGWMMRKGG